MEEVVHVPAWPVFVGGRNFSPLLAVVFPRSCLPTRAKTKTMMARMMVRSLRAPTELPMILMSVFKVGQDLASLKTQAAAEKQTVSGPGSCPSPFLSRLGQKPQVWEKHMATHPLAWADPRNCFQRPCCPCYPLLKI